MLAGRMRVSSTTTSPADSGADTLAIGVFDGETVAHDVKGDALQRLIDAGEARTAFRHVGVAHAADRRWLIVGLGPRSHFTAEKARIVAATALGRANEIGTRALCWELPHHVDDAVAGAFVEGTLLAAYTYTAYKSEPPESRLERVLVSAHHDVSAPVGPRRGDRDRGERRPRPAERARQRDDAHPARRARRRAGGRDR